MTPITNEVLDKYFAERAEYSKTPMEARVSKLESEKIDVLLDHPIMKERLGRAAALVSFSPEFVLLTMVTIGMDLARFIDQQDKIDSGAEELERLFADSANIKESETPQITPLTSANLDKFIDEFDETWVPSETVDALFHSAKFHEKAGELQERREKIGQIPVFMRPDEKTDSTYEASWFMRGYCFAKGKA